jgi:hypothetical protein
VRGRALEDRGLVETTTQSLRGYFAREDGMPIPAVIVWLPGAQDADRRRREAEVSDLLDRLRNGGDLTHA